MTVTQISYAFGCNREAAEEIARDAAIREIMHELGCNYEAATVIYEAENA